MIKSQKCCICDAEYRGHGNSPWPLRDEGRCCDMCAKLLVLPARIMALHGFLDGFGDSSDDKEKHVDLSPKQWYG